MAVMIVGLIQPVFGKSLDSRYRFFNLSTPHFDLHPSEQITEFSCLVLGGGIAQVNVPFQWDVNVDSSLGDRGKLTASAVAGGSAFYKDDLAPFYEGFVTIARDPPDMKILSFDVTVVLTITNNDTGNERKLTFTTNQIILTPTVKRSLWW